MPIYRLIGTKWNISQKLVQAIDEQVPLVKILPLLSRKLQIPSMKNFRVFACQKVLHDNNNHTEEYRPCGLPLNVEMSLVEQGISTSTASAGNNNNRNNNSGVLYFAPIDEDVPLVDGTICVGVSSANTPSVGSSSPTKQPSSLSLVPSQNKAQKEKLDETISVPLHATVTPTNQEQQQQPLPPRQPSPAPSSNLRSNHSFSVTSNTNNTQTNQSDPQPPSQLQKQPSFSASTSTSSTANNSPSPTSRKLYRLIGPAVVTALNSNNMSGVFAPESIDDTTNNNTNNTSTTTPGVYESTNWTSIPQICDENQPLLMALPLIARKLGVVTVRNHKIYACHPDTEFPSKLLDIEESLRFQGVSAGSFLYITTSDAPPQSLDLATQRELDEQRRQFLGGVDAALDDFDDQMKKNRKNSATVQIPNYDNNSINNNNNEYRAPKHNDESGNEEENRENAAALRIQTMARQKQAKTELDRLKKEKQESEAQEERKRLAEKKQEEEAALRIQSAMRQKIAREELDELRKQKKQKEDEEAEEQKKKKEKDAKEKQEPEEQLRKKKAAEDDERAAKEQREQKQRNRAISNDNTNNENNNTNIVLQPSMLVPNVSHIVYPSSYAFQQLATPNNNSQQQGVTPRSISNNNNNNINVRQPSESSSFAVASGGATGGIASISKSGYQASGYYGPRSNSSNPNNNTPHRAASLYVKSAALERELTAERSRAETALAGHSQNRFTSVLQTFLVTEVENRFRKVIIAERDARVDIALGMVHSAQFVAQHQHQQHKLAMIEQQHESERAHSRQLALHDAQIQQMHQLQQSQQQQHQQHEQIQQRAAPVFVSLDAHRNHHGDEASQEDLDAFEYMRSAQERQRELTNKLEHDNIKLRQELAEARSSIHNHQREYENLLQENEEHRNNILTNTTNNNNNNNHVLFLENQQQKTRRNSPNNNNNNISSANEQSNSQNNHQQHQDQQDNMQDIKEQLETLRQVAAREEGQLSALKMRLAELTRLHHGALAARDSAVQDREDMRAALQEMETRAALEIQRVRRAAAGEVMALQRALTAVDRERTTRDLRVGDALTRITSMNPSLTSTSMPSSAGPLLLFASSPSSTSATPRAPMNVSSNNTNNNVKSTSLQQQQPQLTSNTANSILSGNNNNNNQGINQSPSASSLVMSTGNSRNGSQQQQHNNSTMMPSRPNNNNNIVNKQNTNSRSNQQPIRGSSYQDSQQELGRLYDKFVTDASSSPFYGK